MNKKPNLKKYGRGVGKKIFFFKCAIWDQLRVWCALVDADEEETEGLD